MIKALSHESAGIPHSQIKSPGMMLKSKRTENELKTTFRAIQSLFHGYRSKVETQLSKSSSFSSNGSTVSGDSSCPSDSLGQTTNLALDTECQKAKDIETEDQVLDLIKTAKEIFLIYEIELIVCPLSFTNQIFSILEHLTIEVCSFPFDFFKKLSIKQLVITKEANIKNGLNSNEILLLQENLNSKIKVQKKLLNIIFDQLTLINPMIVKEWNNPCYELENKEVVRSETPLKELRNIFMAVMLNLNYPFIQHEKIFFKQILAKYYPALSEEWFVTRCNRLKCIN